MKIIGVNGENHPRSRFIVDMGCNELAKLLGYSQYSHIGRPHFGRLKTGAKIDMDKAWELLCKVQGAQDHVKRAGEGLVALGTILGTSAETIASIVSDPKREEQDDE